MILRLATVAHHMRAVKISDFSRYLAHHVRAAVIDKSSQNFKMFYHLPSNMILRMAVY